MSKLSRISDDASRLEEQRERIVNKRRSSIFNSRTVLFQRSEDIGSLCQGLRGEKQESYNVDETRRATATSLDSEETFDLREYVDRLISETKAWRKLYSDRKTERRYVAKEKRVVECRGQKTNISSLSDTEQKFIMSQPKYRDIEINYKMLSNSAIEVSMLSRLVFQLNENYVRRLEEDLYNVIKRVVRLSESVP